MLKATPFSAGVSKLWSSGSSHPARRELFISGKNKFYSQIRGPQMCWQPPPNCSMIVDADVRPKILEIFTLESCK